MMMRGAMAALSWMDFRTVKQGKDSIDRLARIIHERFCCKRGFAATTSLSAGGLAARSVDILFKDAFLPHDSARPSRVATPHFRDEPS